jgi:peptidoglycan/LPS O-acetylase OafA/YrhL
MSVGHPERTARRDRADGPGAGDARPSAGPGSPSARAERLPSQRLAQIDALRVLSCFSVVAIHALGGPYPPDSVGLGVTSFLLHYSREIFFFVSALVLVRTYYPRLGPDGRLPDETGFRLRRLTLIGVPYLWWTTIYYAVSIFHTRNAQPWSQVLDDLPLRWVYLVVTGNGDYHMYFMLVTIEYALLFPVVLRVLRRTQGHHLAVLAGSLALQVATLYVYQWVYLPDDGWRGIVGDASLPAYQFWLVLGAVAGLHVERCHEWVVRYWRWALAAVPVAAAALLLTYYAQLPGRGALGASSPLQPIMIVWSLAVLGLLYLAASWIMMRGPLRLRAVFAYLAQLTFGIYLAHPMVLDVVLAVLRRAGVMAASVWVSLLSLVLTSVLVAAVCAALHRTPLSQPLMGRRRLDPGTPLPFSPVLRAGRNRRVGTPVLVLSSVALAVLFIGSDQSPPQESGTPNWVEIVEASDQIPQDNPAAGELFSCGDTQSAPHSCPLDGGGQNDPQPPDPGTSG